MRIVPQSGPSLFDGKTCTQCGEWKPFGDFVRSKRNLDGHGESCLECKRIRSQAYYQANKAKVIARTLAYNRAHPEEWKAAAKRYKTAHRERLLPEVRAHSAAWRTKNRDKDRAASLRWSRANKDRVIANVQRRRARIVGNGGSYTSQEWRNLKAQYDHRCLRCGKQEPEIALTVDHVIPISLGGQNTISNIQPLCEFCNKSKHAKTIDYR